MLFRNENFTSLTKVLRQNILTLPRYRGSMTSQVSQVTSDTGSMSLVTNSIFFILFYKFICVIRITLSLHFIFIVRNYIHQTMEWNNDFISLKQYSCEIYVYFRVTSKSSAVSVKLCMTWLILLGIGKTFSLFFQQTTARRRTV